MEIVNKAKGVCVAAPPSLPHTASGNVQLQVTYPKTLVAAEAAQADTESNHGCACSSCDICIRCGTCARTQILVGLTTGSSWKRAAAGDMVLCASPALST
jgi:hypothetical protein